MKRSTKTSRIKNAFVALAAFAILAMASAPRAFATGMRDATSVTNSNFIEPPPGWPPGREYSQSDLCRILNDTPPTLQVRELEGSWREMSLKIPSSSTPAAPDELVFTQGKTVRIGEETFLIAYRAPAKNHTKKNEKSKAARITLDTTLELSLLNLRAVGSLQEIALFELERAPLYLLDIGTPSGDLLLRGQWHDAEADVNWGSAPDSTFRWTTSASQIQLPLPADAGAEISVQVAVLMGPRAGGQVLRVDGREVARVAAGKGKRITSFRIAPAQRAGKSFVVLTFDGPTFPATAPDTRKLGLAVAWIAVETLALPRSFGAIE